MFQKSSKKNACLVSVTSPAQQHLQSPCPRPQQRWPSPLTKATPTQRRMHMLAQHLRYTLSSSKVQSTFDYQNMHSESK